jgi:hypothetical protein
MKEGNPCCCICIRRDRVEWCWTHSQWPINKTSHLGQTPYINLPGIMEYQQWYFTLNVFQHIFVLLDFVRHPWFSSMMANHMLVNFPFWNFNLKLIHLPKLFLKIIPDANFPLGLRLCCPRSPSTLFNGLTTSQHS